jgi:hypothetical protein
MKTEERFIPTDELCKSQCRNIGNKKKQGDMMTPKVQNSSITESKDMTCIHARQRIQKFSLKNNQ